jgi:hypothetical protein
MQTIAQRESSGEQRTRDTVPGLQPALTRPKGGGAIRGIGAKFGANPVTGTGFFAFRFLHRRAVPVSIPSSPSPMIPVQVTVLSGSAGTYPFPQLAVNKGDRKCQRPPQSDSVKHKRRRKR